MGIVVLVLLLAGTVWLTTFHPPLVADEAVTCTGDAPRLEPGQSLEVMSWNVQSMAGTGYVFWYDLLDESGPDERPSPEDIDATFDEVVRVIADEAPDVVVLQEVDDLDPARQAYDEPETELTVLTDAYGSVPSVEEAGGDDREEWFTHAPNDPDVDGPDRTIDFLFHSPDLELGPHSVRSEDTVTISDHLPVIGTYTLPTAGPSG